MAARRRPCKKHSVWIERSWFGMIGIALGVACSSARVSSEQSGGPSLAWPAHLAEGQSDAGAEPRGTAEGSDDGEPRKEHGPPTQQPDPTALASKSQYRYELTYDHGEIRVDGVTLVEFEKEVETAREMGRFAIELWIGHELVERVRFDFPLLAAEPAPSGRRHPLEEPPSLAAGARVSRAVFVPASSRATSARIVDRATGRVVSLPWPPDHPFEAPPRTPAQ